MNPPVDPAALAALRELNPEDPGFLRELIDVFLQDVPLRLAEIERAIAARDAVLLTRAAHTIKGSCGNFGAAALGAVALEIEQQGKSAAFDDATNRLPALRREYTLVADYLRQQR